MNRTVKYQGAFFRIVGFAGFAGKRFLVSPPLRPSIFFFCSRSNFCAITRLKTLAKQLGDENVLRLLLQHNADVNIPDNYGEMPLQRSVKREKENLVRLLLEHSANVNGQDDEGRTLLNWSVKRGEERLVRLLLEHYAYVNIEDKCGFTPLHLSVIGGEENLVSVLLLKHKADVNFQDDNG